MGTEELLRLDNISYISDNQESLVEISFQLCRGENLVLFGPENSGINLLCSIISGIINDFEGDVYYKGKPIKNFDMIEQHNYRKELGYLQSDYGLINNMNVKENISLPLSYHSKYTSAEVEEIVDKMIIELNLEQCRNLRPEDLLRSEQLKAAYARAIALDPDLLLIEHSLESQCLLNVQTFLNNVEKRSSALGKSTVFTTYEPERFTHYSDKFVMLYKGNVVFSGCKDEFLSSNNEFLKQYMNSSLEGPMKIL